MIEIWRGTLQGFKCDHRALAVCLQVLHKCVGQSVVSFEEEDVVPTISLRGASLLRSRLPTNVSHVGVKVELPKERTTVQPVVVRASCVRECFGVDVVIASFEIAGGFRSVFWLWRALICN